MRLYLKVISHKIYNTSVDSFLAFPQVEVVTEIYLEILIGSKVTKELCLYAFQNMYEPKQATKT